MRIKVKKYLDKKTNDIIEIKEITYSELWTIRRDWKFSLISEDQLKNNNFILLEHKNENWNKS